MDPAPAPRASAPAVQMHAHPGFPRLRVCELSRTDNPWASLTLLSNYLSHSSLTDDMMARLLHVSHVLDTLDVGGHMGLSAAVLRRVPPGTPLRVLRACRSGLANDAGLEAAAGCFGATLQVPRPLAWEGCMLHGLCSSAAFLCVHAR